MSHRFVNASRLNWADIADLGYRLQKERDEARKLAEEWRDDCWEECKGRIEPKLRQRPTLPWERNDSCGEGEK